MATDGKGLRGDDLYRSVLTGYGALFLVPRASSGALLLLATFAASPTLGSAVLLGVLASTAVAHVARRDPAQVESGLYGFNGALAGFAVFSLDAPSELAFALVPLLAALTTLLQGWLLDGPWARRLGLPPLSLASLLAGFPLAWALTRTGGYEPWIASGVPLHLASAADLFAERFYGAEIRDALLPSWRSAPVAVLVLLACWLHSRRSLLHLVAGAAIGAMVGYACLGWYGALCSSFVLATAVPTFMALCGVFCAGVARAWCYATLAVAASFFVWVHCGLALREASLPMLTLPFWATTTVLLLALRLMPEWSFLPKLVPLHQVSGPEAGERWARGREVGWRYWQGLARRDGAETAAREQQAALERARALVAGAKRVVAITGAGMSTESGIPDYRTGAVAWKHYDTSHFRWERFLASEESRAKYWEMSQDFYLVLRAAEPNPAHRFFAQLEREGRLERVITQNVDRLHQRAGCSDARVLEIHGNELSVSCLRCGASFERGEVFRWLQGGVRVPYCPHCQGILKPDSIAFDQPMPDGPSLEALESVRNCDLLVIAGTSLEVQPIATLPLVALRAGKPVLVVNLQATDYDAFASAVLRGRVGELLPRLLEPPAGPRP